MTLLQDFRVAPVMTIGRADLADATVQMLVVVQTNNGTPIVPSRGKFDIAGTLGLGEPSGCISSGSIMARSFFAAG